MTDLTSQELIEEFQRMYDEHWPYEWGSAREGCVDCSGAFVNAFRQHGLNIAHGSNSIARNHIVGQLLPIDQARPGMVAFKCRPWTESERGNRWFGQPPGDVHHVGLVDDDVRYVLNAKGEKYGFSRDPIRSWDYVAYIKGITYEEKEASKMQTATVVLPSGAAGKTVNFRTRPDRDAQLVERVPVGSQVEVLEDQGAWCVGNGGSAEPFLPEIGQIYELEYSKDFYGNYCVNGQETGLRRRGNMLCRLFYVENKSNNAIARLYSAYAIDKSNKYVYNLIPCVRKSDNKPGMYDSVSETFYTNSGTGEFIYGPNIEEQSLLIDWTDEIGTIYGGYLDLVKGEVVEEWHKIVADGVNIKANYGSYKSDPLQSYGGAIVYLNPVGEGGASNAFCDNLLLNSKTTIPTIHTYARGQMYAIFYLFPYSDYEEEPTATDIMNATNEWLQEHPTTIVYQLRNPIHHTLTPTQLKTLRGTNNIWSNANGNIELSYWKH